MDFLNGKIKTIYFRYLAAAFGSALITSIYSIVDMAMVGQYHGPEGSAALAVVAPVWNIIYSFGLLMGIGGSVLFSTIRGKSEGQEKRSNEYFTASVIGSGILAAVIWLIVIVWDRELLLLFGAQDNTLSLAREYVKPIKYAIPLFLFNQMLAAYLRNDKNPALATGAVLAGGIFNVFGDYLFVFTCDMGAYGAGLATAIGSAITFNQRTGRIRCYCEYQHLCPVLCLQRGAGVSTHYFHEFRRRQRGAYSPDITICLGHNGVLQYFVDCTEFSSSQPIYSHFYDPYAGGFTNCSGDPALLWHLIYFVAFKYFFYLLFPGFDEAEGGVYRICIQRVYYQWNFDLCAAGNPGGGFYLVCYADYGTACGHLCGI